MFAASSKLNQLRIFACGALLVLFLINNPVHAEPIHAEEVMLFLTDGRSIQGEVNSQTDELSLWIEKRTPQIIFSNSFRWEEIQSIKVQGKIVQKSDVLKLASILKHQSPEIIQSKMNQFWFSEIEFPEISQNENRQYQNQQYDDLSSLNDQHLEERSNHSNRIASIEIDAHVANWDRDSEMDGLIVHLYPLNEQGQLIPISGQISFQLFGQRYSRGVNRRRSDRIPFPELGSWTKKIEQRDFNSNGIRIKLEFRNFNPEAEANLAMESLLTASFGIPGQGKFHASAADVFIRTPSRYRDELYLRSRNQSRIHPKEFTRRHGNSNGSPFLLNR